MDYSICDIKQKKVRKKRIETVLLGVYITTLFFVSYNPSTVFISEGIFICYAVSVLFRHKIKLNTLLIPIFLLAIVSFVSIGWALIPQIALTRSKSIIQMTILLFLTYQTVNSEKDVSYILNSYLIGVLMMYFDVFYTYGFDGVLGSFNSTYRLGLLVNEPNALGRFSAIGFVICLYKVKNKENKIYYIVSLLCMFMTFASGSRQAILIVLTGTLVLVYLNGKNKIGKFISFIIVVLVIYVSYLILSNMFPIFERYGRLFALIFGNEYVDGSITYRGELIKYGIRMFINHPFIGYGTGQFVALSQQYFGVASASHNGFIEVLVSYGIIVFFMYYFLFLRVSYKLYRNSKSINISNLVLAILLMILVSDLAHIGIYDKFTFIFIGLSLATSSLNSKNKNKSNRRV